jgi:hypothetical protein
LILFFVFLILTADIPLLKNYLKKRKQKNQNFRYGL